MSKGKKQKSQAVCDAQFNRTVNRTGKWRGKLASVYKAFKSGNGVKHCDHLFTGKFGKACIFCKIELKDVLHINRWKYLKKRFIN